MGLLDPEKPGQAQFFSPKKVAQAREKFLELENKKEQEQAQKEHDKLQKVIAREVKAAEAPEQKKAREAKKKPIKLPKKLKKKLNVLNERLEERARKRQQAKEEKAAQKAFQNRKAVKSPSCSKSQDTLVQRPKPPKQNPKNPPKPKSTLPASNLDNAVAPIPEKPKTTSSRFGRTIKPTQRVLDNL
ncbi:hypothetical protein CIRG_08602 [Coccidioides immitis RMSCC 2394]|uniref:Uncharacterized protein n=1 Tax=Coccidioides immitis RMSCC 2394 TaxID=404692 RepID=A0A0J6YJT6_COCIT|nr:hypothetical protein CIRG_08602 [Coccidioides immitis RMSCC 2394]